MAKGSSYAVPATPSRGEGQDDSTPGTEDLVTTGRSVSFEDTEFDHDAKDEDDYVDDELEDKAPVQEPDLHEDADVFVTKSGGMKSLSRNLADEFEEAGKPELAHDDIDELNDDLKKPSTMTRGASQLTTKKDGNCPPINGDTPAANKILGQCLNAMLDTSSWNSLFAPKVARQGVWAELVEELSFPVYSTSTSKVAEDTEFLLMAMGMEAHAYPSSTALADWTASEAVTKLQRWKRKLKTAFGRKDVAADDYSSSHEGNPFYQDDDENDATTELVWQIQELTAMKEMDPTPRFEIAQHRPLGKVTLFRGKLDESENYMQWLRDFVYDMT
ncbi:Eukaryotic/viral aspartic protease, partial [Phytophthora megakarya]